jgi:hypothetical protein
MDREFKVKCFELLFRDRKRQSVSKREREKEAKLDSCSVES